LHVTHYYLCSKFIYIKVISTCHAIDIWTFIIYLGFMWIY
jgi:hypothetical protein